MSIRAECPYFLYDKAGAIRCECGKFTFPDLKARQEIVYNYCAHPTDFRKCPFHIALEHYYERKYSKP